MDIMRSIAGMVVLLLIAFLLSVNKKRISLRTVGAALALQVTLGGIMLYFPPGKWLIEHAALGVQKIMSYSDAGSAFIFGSLVGPRMDVLFDGGRVYFCLPRATGHHFRDGADQPALLHRSHGIAYPYPGGDFSEGIKYQ